MKAGYWGAASVLGMALVVGWAWAYTPDSGQGGCPSAGAKQAKVYTAAPGGCPMKGSEAKAHAIAVRGEMTAEQKKLAAQVKDLHAGVKAARNNVAALKAANAPAARQAAAKKQLAEREAKLHKVVMGNRAALQAIGIDCQGQCPSGSAVHASMKSGNCADCPEGAKIAADGAACPKAVRASTGAAGCSKAIKASTDGAGCSKAVKVATDGAKCADCPKKVAGECEGCPAAVKVSTPGKDAPAKN